MPNKVPNVWTLQDAKNRFSEVVREAMEVGPQTVTRRGVPAVVIVNAADYEQERKPFLSLYDAIRPPGFIGADLNMDRPKDPIRTIEFSAE